MRAVKMRSPFTLPPDKYAAWKNDHLGFRSARDAVNLALNVCAVPKPIEL